MRGSVTYDHPYALKVCCLGRWATLQVGCVLESTGVTSNSPSKVCLTCAGDRSQVLREHGRLGVSLTCPSVAVCCCFCLISGWDGLIVRRVREIAKSHC